MTFSRSRVSLHLCLEMSCVRRKDLPQELHVSWVVGWAVVDCCLHLCRDKACLRRKDFAQVQHVSWVVGWAVVGCVWACCSTFLCSYCTSLDLWHLCLSISCFLLKKRWQVPHSRQLLTTSCCGLKGATAVALRLLLFSSRS